MSNSKHNILKSVAINPNLSGLYISFAQFSKVLPPLTLHPSPQHRSWLAGTPGVVRFYFIHINIDKSCYECCFKLKHSARFGCCWEDQDFWLQSLFHIEHLILNPYNSTRTTFTSKFLIAHKHSFGGHYSALRSMHDF